MTELEKMMTSFEAVFLSTSMLRLLLAGLLGSIVGLERASNRKPAGLRTIMFITFGSCLFTVISEGMATMHGGDVTRIAAQLVSGIGFLGAGSIVHARGSVVGLTTAATIFVMASIGMACGSGLYAIAIFSTICLMVGLVILGRVEHHFAWHARMVVYTVTSHEIVRTIEELNRALEEDRLPMQQVRCRRGVTDKDPATLEFTINAPEELENKLLERFMELPTVETVQLAESDAE